MEGLLDPIVTESYLGRAEVRNTFKVKGIGTIAGCYVTDGVLKRDASEVRTGFECGVGISNFNDVKVGDLLEAFQVTKSQPGALA